MLVDWILRAEQRLDWILRAELSRLDLTGLGLIWWVCGTICKTEGLNSLTKLVVEEGGIARQKTFNCLI